MHEPKFIGEAILLIPETGKAILTNGKDKVIVPVEELTDDDLSMCHSEEFFKKRQTNGNADKTTDRAT